MGGSDSKPKDRVSPENVPPDNPESSKYGEPQKFDPTFKGPIQKRGCTDVLCCLLFFVCILGAAAVTVLALLRGDPIKLLYPTDSEGNICGYGKFVDKPNLFFFDLLDCAKTGPAVVFQGCPTPQVCVKECPSGYFAWAIQHAKEEAMKAAVSRGVQSSVDTSGRSEMICKYAVTDPETSPKVCVADCPDHFWTWHHQHFIESINPNNTYGRSNMICKRQVHNPVKSEKSVLELVEDEDCAAYYVESSPVVGRCLPSFLTELVDKAKELTTAQNETIVDKFNNTITDLGLQKGSEFLAILLNAKEYGMKIYQDVRASWWMMLIALAIAMILSFLWIVLMRWIAGIMVWVTILLFIGIFSFTTYYTFNRYVDMKGKPEHQVQGSLAFTTNLDYYWNLADTWLVLGITSAVFLGIIVLLLIFLRKRILIAIAIIREASRAVGSMIFTLFWPLIPFVLELALFFWWGVAAVYLASSGEPEYSQSNKTVLNVSDGSGSFHLEEEVQKTLEKIPCDPHENSTAGSVCSFVKYGGDQYTVYLQIYMLFMLFWTMNFIIALGQMTLAGAFASYYWAYNKPQDIPAFPVAASFWRCFRFHMGSLAFGALLIAIIQMIRVFLEYIDHKVKGSENPIAKFLLKCLKCCFWCLEKFMRFINKNAYIMIAVYGKNFCISAKNAFMLIMRNIVRTVVVDKVTDFLLFIGKLVIVGLIGILSFFFFSGEYEQVLPVSTFTDYLNTYRPVLNFYLIPIIIIIVGSFIIASAFFSVYGMGVDTLFLSFLEDLERHDGTPEKPYYMSRELMKILGKKNKKAEKK